MAKKTPGKKAIGHPRAVSIASSQAAAPVYAPGAFPAAGRQATIGRLTEALASPKAGIDGAAHLQPFFDRLRQLEGDPASGVVRILQFGDSHTAADMFTGAMRTRVPD